MSKLQDLLFRASIYGAEVKYDNGTFIIVCQNGAFLTSKDLYTLLEESGVKVDTIYARDNSLIVNISMKD